MTTEANKQRDASKRREAGIIEGVTRRAARGMRIVELSLGTAEPLPKDEVIVAIVSGAHALVSRTHVRGRSVDMKEMWLRLAGAEAAVERIAASPPEVALPALTAGEAALLDQAGFREGSSPTAVSAVDRSQIELDAMLGESLTLEEAAGALGVSPSRLRQRLSSAERTLFGVKEGRGWRIPKFQFATKSRLVRGIEKVLPHVRPDAHPLAVKMWFTSPHQDLVLGEDEHPVSPVEWLAAGQSPREAAKLAAEI